MTSSTTQNFDAWLAEQREDPVVEFTLGGRAFHVRNPLPSAPGLRLVREMIAAQGENALMWRDFIAGLILEPASELDEAVAASGIHAEGLKHIGSWISEQSTGRPTSRSSPSRRRPSTPGRSGKSVSRKSTSTRAPRLSVAS